MKIDQTAGNNIIGGEKLEKRERTENREMTEQITRLGNPGKPQGEEGEAMLERMNDSHYEVTGWGLSHWEIEERDAVLDIGCGGGATLHRMARHITTGSLTGVDYSRVSLETSRKNNEEDVENGKITLVEASVEHLPFADDSFDKIVTVESFYFWPDPPENLKEVYRVLASGGTFLLIADIQNEEGLSEKILENIARYHLFNPTKAEFEKYFADAGFSRITAHTKEGEHWICVEGHKE